MGSNIVDDIWAMKSAGEFEPYIDEIEFPHFKNLDRGFSIKFDFPVTAIVGQNGTNKSSILRALQACPDQNSISDHWFDTDLDRIDSEPGDRQRYIHRYRVPSGCFAEVVKVRIQKESRGRDYFETSKPLKKDGMSAMPDFDIEDAPFRSKTRWKPIEKNVVYLDFRAQLPAFDILMSFENRFSSRDAAGKKRLVRLRTKHLNHIFSSGQSSCLICGKERQLSSVISLKRGEISEIEAILGKEYSAIELVKHDLFDYAGWTVRLVSGDLDYSEAFAGSGEFAVVMIVHSMNAAEPGSLVLLDEPETSLHPGAQMALCSFLLESAKRKRFQIVMATHSKEMISLLPDKARKLIGIIPGKKTVSMLRDSASLEESFYRLGVVYSRDVIYVEDALAAEIVKSAARARGEDTLGAISVEVFPGGADAIMTKLVPALALTNRTDAIVLLDGDKRPATCIEAPQHNLEDCIVQLNRIKLDKKYIAMNGGRGENKDHQISQINKVLEWVKGHVDYLPGKDPEGLLAAMVDGTPIVCSDTCESAKNKSEWVSRAHEAYRKSANEDVSSDEILNYQKMQLAESSESSTSVKVRKEILACIDNLFG